MRSDSPTTLSEEDAEMTSPKAINRLHIVPIERTPDAMSMFASEEEPADGQTSPVHIDEPEVAVPVITAEPKPQQQDGAKTFSPTLARRWVTRDIALVLLTLVAITQSGFIAFWRFSDKPVVAASTTGSLAVTSEPSGVPVAIDGHASGATPISVALAAGIHRIDVGAGAQLRSQEVRVKQGGDASLHIGLTAIAPDVTAETGELQIVTEPPGGRVWVDGEARAVAPVTVSNLPLGEHTVTVRGGAGAAINRTVNVQKAQVASLVVSMNGATAFASGSLAVTSEVPLQIREKGTVVGTTEMPRILLPAGAHELELVNPALEYRLVRSVQITAGQTTVAEVKTPMGKISINALPWADVWIDGKPAGETPIGNFTIAIGNHEILFRHPELTEQRRTIAVGALTPQRIGVDMRKP